MGVNKNLITIILPILLLLISALSCLIFTTTSNGTRTGEFELLTMSCQKENKSMNPGEIVMYDVLITNNLNVTLDVVFHFYGQGGIIDSLQIFNNNWSGGFLITNVTLLGQEQKNVVFQIGVPVNAIGGTDKAVQLNAIGYDDFGIDYEAPPIYVTALTNIITNISVKAAQDSQWCVPDNNVNYTITITNNGNSDNIFDLNIYDIPMGWTFELESSACYLGPSEDVPVDIKIIVPANALADADPETSEQDPYRIGINITDREKMLGWGETIYVKLFVEKISKFRITTIESNKFASSRSTCDFTFRLDNLGNAIDLAKLNILRNLLGDEWKIYFPYLSLNSKIDRLSRIIATDFSNKINVTEFRWDILYIPLDETFSELAISLNVGGSVYIGMNVEIPEVNDGEIVSFSVEARNESGVEVINHTLDFSIEIKMADLYIIGNITTTELTLGKNASFTVTIGNKGEMAVEKVEITLFVDNKRVDTRNLSRIVVGDEKLVTFVWPVNGGEHKVTVAVDPNNVIAETYENNNVRSMSIDIDEAIKKDKKSPGFEIFYLVVIFIIVVCYKFYMRKGV